MTDQSLNAGLDLEEQDKPTSNVDIPPNPDIVGEINSQEVVVNTDADDKSVEELREDLAGSYEALDNLMDIRARMKAQKRVNQDLALEALEVAPQISLPHTKSYTEDLTRVNYKESLEAVESVIDSALSVIKDKSVDLDKRILIPMPSDTTSTSTDELKENMNAFISVNGMHAITCATVDPETKATLFEALTQSPSVAKLLENPDSFNGVCDSINKLYFIFHDYRCDRLGYIDALNTAITNNSEVEEKALALNEHIQWFMNELEARGLYSEVTSSDNIDTLISQISTLYLNLRSYSNGLHGKVNLQNKDWLTFAKEGLEDARSFLQEPNEEINCPESLNLDQKTVVVSAISNLVEARKLGITYIDDASQFIDAVIRILTIWSKGLTVSQ